MADFVEDRVGQQLGNYRLLRLLRQEGTTALYLGGHIFLDRQAAIKVLPEQLSPQELESFLAETRTIARMKHPNILRILEFGVKGKTPFLVTDYTPDGSLRQRHPEGTIVPPGAIMSYTRQVAAALQYIHDQGLVYGGVRPENMLLGSQDRILLSDFSPTIDTLDEALTRDASWGEKEAIYRAPEQFQGQTIPASDQYALGVTVYEWLNVDTPFHSSNSETQEKSLLPLSTKMPTTSPELVQVVTTALAQDPQQRFANVTAFADALERQLQPEQSITKNESTDGIPTGQLQPAQPIANNDPASGTQNAGTIICDLPVPARKFTRRNLTNGVAISLVLLALLLIGGAFTYSAGIFPFSRQKATVITSAQAAQTVLARGTQLAVAAFTSRSPQQIYNAATRGSPFLNDPLNNKSKSAWFSVQGSPYGCTFAGGTYHLQIAKVNSYLDCPEANSTFHNFAFEVEMSIVKSNSGVFGGIIFRSNQATSNFYTFGISSNNSTVGCDLSVFNNNNPRALQLTIAQVNLQKFTLLTAIAYESAFYFYLNKNLVMQSRDNTLSTGTVGMYAASGSSPTTDVIFRNAKVWKL